MLRKLLQSAIVLTLCTSGVLPAAAQEISIKVTGAIEHNGAQRVKAAEQSGATRVETTVKAPSYKSGSLSFAVDPAVTANLPDLSSPATGVSNIPAAGNNNRDITLTATLTKPDAQVTSTIRLHIDSKAPEALNPVVDRFPGGSGSLTIRFKDNDLDPKSVQASDFRVFQE